MSQQNGQKVKAVIKNRVTYSLNKLPSHLKEWAKLHLIEPKKITVYNSLKSAEQDSPWLVTDNKGIRDAGYRVVYNEELDMFGLIMDLADGRIYCLGYSGDFDKAVEGM